MHDKRPLTFTLFLARLLSGFVGGLAGTLALFIVFFILNSLLPSSEETTSISIFVTIVMAFLGTLVANVVAGLMVTFVDSQKYRRRKTVLAHVFMFNVLFFFFAIPFYIVGSGMNIVNAIAALHLLLSAFVSALLMEIIAGYEYALTGIYSAALGILLSIGLAFIILAFKLEITMVLFLAMPIVWVILQVAGGFVELLYDGFVHFYGIEALSVQTDLGGDTEKEPEENEFEEGVDKEDGN